ncbi:MAG: gamma-glutamyl-gamma-aminobutyrate hydrolase [Gammaproteobacteria bacterium HGW-Gammaproteobacteria-4]|jgi:putative glutamine amidotransferase|nr:MAG: gamma-glutamyl-gamma-aminobutyrate hydrolase [Gammaproteobacteria bacterium HGW-Gammaproteobacteria-4]
MPRAPLIGLPSDRKMVGAHPFQCVGEKYISAAVVAAEALPVLLPSLQPALDWAQMLDRLDGLILTGSPSNIEPHHYSGEVSYEGNLHDAARDANTLGLVRLAIAHQVPVLALCRGLQEVNVALGGSLHQKVHEQPGFDDHRENKDDPLDRQYAPSHAVHLAAGGILRQLAGSDSVMVNSLHGQGIRALAPGLVVEATAPDGLIEAVRLDRGDTFLLAVQWHPEWKVAENPFYLAIFHAFADACRQRMNQRV